MKSLGFIIKHIPPYNCFYNRHFSGLCMVTHSCNLSFWKVETRSVWSKSEVLGQPGLHSNIIYKQTNNTRGTTPENKQVKTKNNQSTPPLKYQTKNILKISKQINKKEPIFVEFWVPCQTNTFLDHERLKYYFFFFCLLCLFESQAAKASLELLILLFFFLWAGITYLAVVFNEWKKFSK